ncbi:MAG TPA: hypothetical protein DCQ83_08270 [Fibrobacteres bacterium]|nr:hypothetical protein [Fibrobacterota bacterium]
MDALNHRIAFLPILALTAIGFGDMPYKPNAYQQNDWFAEFGENLGSYVNPASIAEADQIEVGAGVYRTLSGKAGQEFVSAVHPFGYNHTVALTYFENGSDIEGSNASYLENAYILGYALRMPWGAPGGISHKVALGVNATIFQYDPFGALGGVQYAYGADVGLVYNPFTASSMGQLLLGVAVQNALQPKVKTTTGSYHIPRNLNASLFWRGFNRKLELAGSASVLDITHESTEGGKGNQIVPTGRITWYVQPWAGLKLKYSKQGYPVGGITLNVQRLNLFRYLQIDVDMSHDALTSDNQERGFVWNVRATTRLGPTREERIGDARYRRLLIEPEEAYRKAMQLYLARKFLPAAYAFGVVTSKYPTFHLVDQAAFYKGKAFESLRMNDAAQTVYEDALRKFTDSDLRPKYMFQIMNIYYKEGKYDDASRLHQQLVNLYPESDVKADADYVMGQIKYLKRDYNGAIALLSPIVPGNGNYPYARYTMGVSYAGSGKMSEAEAAFQNVAELKPSNSAGQEMKDAAMVKLGHINFGKPMMKKAAEYYVSVSTNSPHYDEALLGLAWAFLKEKNFKGAADYANAIISKTPNSLQVPEAHLLLGYCAFFAQNYDQALSEFDKVVDLAEKKASSIQDMKKQRGKNPANSPEYAAVQKEAEELSDQLPTDRVVEKQAQLRSKFDAVYAKVEKYYEFQRDAERYEKFLQDKTRIVKDAKFTKATVINIKAGSGGKKSGPSQQDLKGLEVE